MVYVTEFTLSVRMQWCPVGLTVSWIWSKLNPSSSPSSACFMWTSLRLLLIGETFGSSIPQKNTFYRFLAKEILDPKRWCCMKKATSLQTKRQPRKVSVKSIFLYEMWFIFKLMYPALRWDMKLNVQLAWFYLPYPRILTPFDMKEVW